MGRDEFVFGIVMLLGIGVFAQTDTTMLFFDNLNLSSDHGLNKNPQNNKPIQLINRYDPTFNASNNGFVITIHEDCELELTLTNGTGIITLIINGKIDDRFTTKEFGRIRYEFLVSIGDVIEVRVEKKSRRKPERNLVVGLKLIKS